MKYTLLVWVFFRKHSIYLMTQNKPPKVSPFMLQSHAVLNGITYQVQYFPSEVHKNINPSEWIK